MIGKKHISNGQIIFACCDDELLNTKISFENITIEINEGFYGITIMSQKEILKNINEADSINVFGKKTCSFLIDNKIISKEQIVYFGGIPHIQIYKL